MHTSGHQYILSYFLFQIMVYKTETIKICRFEIRDGVKYVNCIKHAYKFLLKEQVGFFGRSLTLASMSFFAKVKSTVCLQLKYEQF